MFQRFHKISGYSVPGSSHLIDILEVFGQRHIRVADGLIMVGTVLPNETEKNGIKTPRTFQHHKIFRED